MIESFLAKPDTRFLITRIGISVLIISLDILVEFLGSYARLHSAQLRESAVARLFFLIALSGGEVRRSNVFAIIVPA